MDEEEKEEALGKVTQSKDIGTNAENCAALSQMFKEGSSVKTRIHAKDRHAMDPQTQPGTLS